MTDEQFAEFFQSYIECALWSSFDPETGEPLDALYFSEDLTLVCRNAMRRDCASFVANCASDLASLDPEQCGHDFWLTRNRHGAGFWDRGLGALGERLTLVAHSYGSVDLCVNDDGKVDV